MYYAQECASEIFLLSSLTVPENYVAKSISKGCRKSANPNDNNVFTELPIPEEKQNKTNFANVMQRQMKST